MLLHQGIGLGTFNALPERRAVHAVYECANSLPVARELVRGRGYPDHESLLRRSDEVLGGLPDDAVDRLLEGCRTLGCRPGSVASRAEQCAVAVADAEVAAELAELADRYARTFGFDFVMCVDGRTVDDVREALHTRLGNDPRTETAVVRAELARINRARLQRMLGPEDGYQNW